MCQEFRNQVIKSAEIAIEEANNKDVKGDPGSHPVVNVDGRKGFAQDFKDCGDKKGKKYEIGPVTLNTDGYSIHITGLKGTNIQNHKKKIHMYRKFAELMESEGWNVGLDISPPVAY